MERKRFAPKEVIPSLTPLLVHCQVQSPGEIIWDHRINDLLGLKVAVKSKAHFIEGDVRQKDEESLMNHDPLTGKNEYLTLKRWAETISLSGQGMKLDFKETEAVEPSLSILKELAFPSQRLILHASVFKGPDDREPVFQPDIFSRQCRAFSPDVLVSFGFTTSPGCSSFTQEMIKEAVDFVSSVQPAIICIRVELATEEIMEQLINRGIPVTLWSDQDERLGENWWLKNWPNIRRWQPFALMDFPDFSIPRSTRQE